MRDATKEDVQIIFREIKKAYENRIKLFEEELKKRIEIRRQSSGRADDEAEKVLKRVDEYFNKTVHVLPYYKAQSKLTNVQGIGEITAIFNEICSVIDGVK